MKYQVCHVFVSVFSTFAFMECFSVSVEQLKTLEASKNEAEKQLNSLTGLCSCLVFSLIHLWLNLTLWCIGNTATLQSEFFT